RYVGRLAPPTILLHRRRRSRPRFAVTLLRAPRRADMARPLRPPNRTVNPTGGLAVTEWLSPPTPRHSEKAESSMSAGLYRTNWIGSCHYDGFRNEKRPLTRSY
ncbi:hypothetical protein ACJJTC_011273, partial [Scirpophaga incertulas]